MSIQFSSDDRLWDHVVFPWLKKRELLTLRLVSKRMKQLVEGSVQWNAITRSMGLRKDEIGFGGLRLAMLRRWDGQELFVDDEN
jgi:hypothetical protein